MPASKVYYTTAQPIPANVIIHTESPLDTSSSLGLILQCPELPFADGQGWSITGFYSYQGHTSDLDDVSSYDTDYNAYVASPAGTITSFGLRLYDNSSHYETEEEITTSGLQYPYHYPVEVIYSFLWEDISQGSLILPSVGDIIIEDIITGDEVINKPHNRRYWSIFSIDPETPIHLYVQPIGSNDLVNIASGLRGPTGATGPTGPTGPVGPSGTANQYSYGDALDILKQ